MGLCGAVLVGGLALRAAVPTAGHAGTVSGPGTCDRERVLRPSLPPLAGEDVVELQERLRQLGFYPGPVHGFYDGPTAAAVRALEGARGVRPTGIVTAGTWFLLAEGRSVAAAPATPPPSGEVTLLVDTFSQILTVLVEGRPVRRYPVAVGKPWTPSPPGEWRVVEKLAEPGGPFGSRWLGLDVPWGGYGIHGTNRPWSIGQAASAGCIRMHNADVAELYETVPVGTVVVIRGPLTPAVWVPLRRGSVGQEVVALQLRLRAAGFPAGRADGRFGALTEEAVRGLERFYGLPEDGLAGPAVLHLLGLGGG